MSDEVPAKVARSSPRHPWVSRFVRLLTRLQLRAGLRHEASWRHVLKMGQPAGFCFVLTLLLCVFATIEANAGDLKRVLILHSFGRDFDPWSDFANKLRTELIKASKNPIDLYEASIFTARFQEPENEDSLAEYLKELFSKRKLDLVITNGAPAAYFVQDHRKQLFSDLPLLITGIGERRVSSDTLTANDTVVASKLDIKVFVNNILQLRPETKEIVIVFGNSDLEKFWITHFRRDLESYLDRVKFIWWNDLSLEEMMRKAARLAPQSAILYFWVCVDANGVTHPLDRAFAPIRAAASAPMFGYGDYQLGQGIVGGPLVSHEAQGPQAAHVALRILNGESPSNIKTPAMEMAAPVYDWRELQRWGINEGLLPPGSLVQFREPSLWVQYRWQIILIAFALVLQTALIFALLIERGRRQRAEIKSRDRLAELTHMNRRAAAGEASASLAHEINQPLAAIVSSGNAGLRWLTAKPPDHSEVKAALERIVSDGHRAAQVIETLRGMYRKDEPEKTLLDVNTAIRHVLSFLRYELEHKEIVVKTVLMDELPRVLVDQTQFMQVLLNLIINAAEAMSALPPRRRLLRLRSEVGGSQDVIVTVEDTGPGVGGENLERIFDPFFTTKPTGMGMGLAICRTIVEANGGQLTAEPQASGGMHLRIALPAKCAG